jgi:hypothetical protein
MAKMPLAWTKSREIYELFVNAPNLIEVENVPNCQLGAKVENVLASCACRL